VDELHVTRDLLDKQLVDRENRPMGKVDGILMEFPEGRPPRLKAIEIGATVVARRVNARLERIVARWYRRLGISDGAPERVPLSKIVHFGNDVQLDMDAERTSVYDVEHWLRDRVIARIPGSGE
jgi:hypothetical protein